MADQTKHGTPAVRPARAEDLEGVFGLVAECGLHPEGIAERFPEGYVVAVEGDDLIGCAGTERYGPYGLLRSVAVAPRARARGIGRLLVRDRIEGASREGLAALYLLTIDAGPFFERCGFVAVDRAGIPAAVRESLEFASLCPATAIAMGVLSPGPDRP